jgi:hypothetical protein
VRAQAKCCKRLLALSHAGYGTAEFQLVQLLEGMSLRVSDRFRVDEGGTVSIDWNFF